MAFNSLGPIAFLEARSEVQSIWSKIRKTAGQPVFVCVCGAIAAGRAPIKSLSKVAPAKRQRPRPEGSKQVAQPVASPPPPSASSSSFRRRHPNSALLLLCHRPLPAVRLRRFSWPTRRLNRLRATGCHFPSPFAFSPLGAFMWPACALISLRGGGGGG